MWGKFIWLMSAALIAYLIGTSPWTKIQARRIWDEFLRKSAGPWGMIERIYRRIDSNLIGRIFLATLGLLLVILLVFWVTHIKFDLFKDTSFKVTGWDDLRTLGWALSGVVATWLAIVGAILSAARTGAMEESNKVTSEANQETRYNRLNARYDNALKLLNGGDFLAFGAIKTIKEISLEDESLIDKTIDVMTGYLHRNARIDDEKNRTSSKHVLMHPHVEIVLNSIIQLQDRRIDFERIQPENFLRLSQLDLREINVSSNSQITSITFANCNMAESVILGVGFKNVSFNNCILRQAILNASVFLDHDFDFLASNINRSNFEGAFVSELNFSAINNFERTLMARTIYSPDLPPINFPCSTIGRFQKPQRRGHVPSKPVLPPPYDLHKEKYFTHEETREFHQSTNNEFRPRHQDGTFVTIVDPDDPINVILD